MSWIIEFQRKYNFASSSVCLQRPHVKIYKKYKESLLRSYKEHKGVLFRWYLLKLLSVPITQ